MTQPWLQGDFIQNGSDKRKVLGVAGDVIFAQNCFPFDDEGKGIFMATQKQYEGIGFYLVPKEEEWPKKDDRYFYCDDDGSVLDTIWVEDYWHPARKAWGNCHRDEADAVAWREKVKAIKNPKT